MLFVAWRYSEILAIASKWQFLPRWLRVSGSCRSIWSSVSVRVQNKYSLSFTRIYRTGMCISKFCLSDACPGFLFCMTFWSCSSFSTPQISVPFSATLGIRQVEPFVLFQLSTVPVITPFVFASSAILVIRPSTSASVIYIFSGCARAVSTSWIASIGNQFLLVVNTYVVAYIPFSSFLTIFFKISYNQPIRFSWLQTDVVKDMTSPLQSPSRVALLAVFAPGDNPVAATAAVSALPTLATELPP